MIYVKDNFKNKYQNNMNCDLCGEYENQQHLLECHVLIMKCQDLYNDTGIQYEDIFANVSKQLPAVQLFQKVLDTREKLLKEKATRDNLVQCTV